MNAALNPFRDRILKIERKYIKNKYLPINTFLMELKEFHAFFNFLKQFIDEVESQKIIGCAILSALHKYNYFSDLRSKQALKTVQRGVYAVFLRQLSQWLMYGELVDVNGEFFIVRCKGINKGNAMTTTTSELIDTDNEQWDINYSMIPTSFSTSWAEKVLFIGQIVNSVIIGDSKGSAKRIFIWRNDEENAIQIDSFWNSQEHVFFGKIQSLSNCHDSSEYEQVVNEIKLFVTERLSEIAFNQADLIKHLKLFREYFLLGRGELFSEFISQLQNTKNMDIKENQAYNREIIQAFQRALNKTSIETDLVSVYLDYCRIDFDTDIDDLSNLIRLEFDVKWPLHLIFSRKVFEQYNNVFSFLLKIRHVQNDLHVIWRFHREKRIAGNSLLCQLRNKMLFLIDILQYYLQVDVVEAQFSILISTIQHTKDFDQIIRAHNLFLGNILSLSFLLNSNSSPVLEIFKKIFKIIRNFCRFSEYTGNNEELSLRFEEIDQM